MTKLSKTSQIWVGKITESDLTEAINYATISLPWTFDRMRYGQTTANSMNKRLLNILIGVLNQTILERIFQEKGFSCSKDWTKYRESDIFDFKINDRVYDVKTSIIFSELNRQFKRQAFSPEFLMENKGYSGVEWKHFFPCMVALSQLVVERKKDAYIFGIGEMEKNFRSSVPEIGDSGFWCSVPFGSASSFFHSKGLINERESQKKGFFPKFQWTQSQTEIVPAKDRKIFIKTFGEWNGAVLSEEIVLTKGSNVQSRNEYSSLSCIKIDHPAILSEFDQIIVTVKNNFKDVVTKITDPSTNLNDSKFEWKISKQDCVNLKVPADYKIYWLGFIPTDEYIEIFQKYPSYFIPHPREINCNVPAQIHLSLKSKFDAFDRRRQKFIDKGISVNWPEFNKLIINKEIHAGILVSVSRPGGGVLGAASYCYPGGYGFYESAMYVLPKDLTILSDLE